MLRTILIVRKETCCHHMGYSFRLAARFILYASSHRQDSAYHGLCYISCGALAGMRNSSMSPPHEGSIRRPIAPWANILLSLTQRAGLKPIGPIAPNWVPRLILQTLVQVDWEPGPTEIVSNWAPHLLRPALHTHKRTTQRNVLFNDALNTFYLRLYGVRHMVKDHSDSEKRNPLPPHRLLLSINNKGSFICTIPQTG